MQVHKIPIDYILAENIDDDKNFVFETPFNMFVYLLLSALEKHATFKNVFLRNKTPKLFKETWFTRNAKTYYVNGSWASRLLQEFIIWTLVCL